MTFNGKVALVTGGASGIGREHTKQLVEKGAKVAILDLNEEGLQETKDFSPENVYTFKCDVTNLEQVQNTVARVEDEIGPIDRLVHCAAIMPGGLLLEVPADQITRVMQINYFGTVNVIRTVVPYMVERDRGDVIVYGSTAGVVPSAKFGAYGSTKAAVNFFMKVLIEENKHTNLRFQLVCPPVVDTPLVNQAKDTGPDLLKNVQTTRKMLLTPDYVVNSVEKALDKGNKENFPSAQAKMTKILSAFPGLLMKLDSAYNSSTTKSN